MDVDTAWLRARKKELHISDKDISAAINRERSTGNRIVTGERKIEWDEIHAMAKVFEVSEPEMALRAGYDPNSETMRSGPKRDAVRRIDDMGDNEVTRLVIPMLVHIADLSKKPDPDDEPEEADGPTEHEGAILRSVR